jgi:hypothetical protein
MTHPIRDAEHAHNLANSPFTASNTRPNKSSLALQHAFWAGFIAGMGFCAAVLAVIQ